MPHWAVKVGEQMFKMGSLGSCLRLIHAGSMASCWTLSAECTGVVRNGIWKIMPACSGVVLCLFFLCLELAHSATLTLLLEWTLPEFSSNEHVFSLLWWQSHNLWELRYLVTSVALTKLFVIEGLVAKGCFRFVVLWHEGTQHCLADAAWKFNFFLY